LIAAVWNETLERLIEREVVLQDAFAKLRGRGKAPLDKLREVAAREFDRQWLQAARRRSNLKTDEELDAFLRTRGTSLEVVRRQGERDFVAREYLSSRAGRVETGEQDESARQEMKRFVARLKRAAVIEYAGGR
jgi:hypothetical protein